MWIIVLLLGASLLSSAFIVPTGRQVRLHAKHVRVSKTLVRASSLEDNLRVGDDVPFIPEPPNFNEPGSEERRIVIIAGFENFNIQLYKRAVATVEANVPNVKVDVFTDADINERPEAVDDALRSASVLFCSLVFDYNQINWIKDRIGNIPTRFCFESALELMSETKVGSFSMDPGKGPAGPPPAVKAVLKQFGSSKEEDKMTGYLKFLKVGPSLLKYVPKIGAVGDKVQDLRTWLTVYSYWNQGAYDNVVSMLYTIIRDFDLANSGTAHNKVAGQSDNDGHGSTSVDERFNTKADMAPDIRPPTATISPPEPAPVRETPPYGIYHPQLFEKQGYLDSPGEYVEWYEKTHSWVTADTPRVGILLYRKHVVSEQGYIPNMITLLEAEGIMPIPIFITGVEAHVVVRDFLTTSSEQKLLTMGGIDADNYRGSLREDAARVDFIVNTIGFPLVGGPAGSMEGGRQIEAAKEILTRKNVPYVVAAPLLIQDTNSWQNSGVQGLQTVVLYSLPELDGAIETIVLGGLVGGDKIVILPERVRKLTNRIKSWVRLRKSAAEERKLAVMVYGFPPNVGAVGTAALLNVGGSLRNILQSLHTEGVNVGSDAFRKSLEDPEWGDKFLSALRVVSQEYMAVSPESAVNDAIEKAGLVDVRLKRRVVRSSELRAWLGKQRTARIENQWGGDLGSFTGLGTVGSGQFAVQGLEFGNVFVGIQPLLGLEGDPMRLLFERDLTPHPQYAAFYTWLKEEQRPHAMVHFGMHGTVEWLPGSPLGSTAESWPDILLGETPNVYIYACNNPSESILAKRRGYATIVSHNVPPYAKAGLYTQLSSLRELINDYRSETDASTRKEGDYSAQLVIVSAIEKIGLFDDVPLSFTHPNVEPVSGAKMSAEYAEKILQGPGAAADEFNRIFSPYLTTLLEYLSELENRLFSEGLYEIGASTTTEQVQGYLNAVTSPVEESDMDEQPDGVAVPQVSEHTLRAIASAAIKGDTFTDTLLKARGVQNHYTSDVHGGPVGSFAYDPDHLDSLDNGSLFTLEDKFGFSLLKSDPALFLKLQFWRLERAFGSEEAEAEINDLIAVGGDMETSDSKGEASNANDKTLHRIANDLKSATEISQILASNGRSELDGVLKGLKGEYVAPAPGGDLIRDGASVLPTGRNIHSLDPYRMPSEIALARGKQAAEIIVQSHYEQYGAYPETVAVTLWGLDAIKTKGESVGIVLGLLNADPIREGTGRIVGFKLNPLLPTSRPRIDVLASLSGIFRDSFGNVLDLLDNLFEAAATTDESIEENFVKKHSLQLSEQGVERSYSRLFSNPAGDFGSMVNERIGSGDWADADELGDTWEKRNSFSYGATKGGQRENGQARPELLKGLLSTTDRIIQEVDSVEYGLTDIQEYYANTGALKKAAEINRADEGLIGSNAANLKSNAVNGDGAGRAPVGVSIVEAFSKTVKPRELEETLRLEYRTKLLNPKWAEAMAKQGAAGAYEISGRMTAMIGWAATTDFSEKWVWDGAAENYILDEEMAARLRKANPEAFRNMVKRMLEANGRGFWQPSDEVIMQLQDVFDDVEDEIEGVA
jgi:magnesium chelatase subunit H